MPNGRGCALRSRLCPKVMVVPNVIVEPQERGNAPSCNVMVVSKVVVVPKVIFEPQERGSAPRSWFCPKSWLSPKNVVAFQDHSCAPRSRLCPKVMAEPQGRGCVIKWRLSSPVFLYSIQRKTWESHSRGCEKGIPASHQRTVFDPYLSLQRPY